MSLKKRIIKVLPAHAGCFTNIQGSPLYIRDMKAINGGLATIDCTGCDVAAVELQNPLLLTVDFDAFPNNALPLDIGKHEKQCECVLFPEGADEKEWVLFVETKYVNSLENAKKREYGYPQLMVKQIKKTVAYFREKNILPSDKKVYAIVSYPTLEEGFDSWCFPVKYDDGTTESVEDILFNDRIHIRATNCATIRSVKRIKLGD